MRTWQLMLILAAVYDATGNLKAAIAFIIVASMFFVADLF